MSRFFIFSKIIFLIFCAILTTFVVSDQKLRVFVIPHSHIDEGWLRTVEEYRGEANQIMQSVYDALRSNPNRKFTWSEVTYFKQCLKFSKILSNFTKSISNSINPGFEQQPLEKQNIIKYLIQQKRFEIVNGGWISNDEV